MSDQKTKKAGCAVPTYNPNIWDIVSSSLPIGTNGCSCDGDKRIYTRRKGNNVWLCPYHFREATALHQAAVTTSALEPTLRRLESRIDKLETMLKSLIDLLDRRDALNGLQSMENTLASSAPTKPAT
ncbi:MAG: hypothetical protein KGL39_10835 [Patescibacteria group bacterium]|nr:hypothetical protein [Patescibacteria group bacterium]